MQGRLQYIDQRIDHMDQYLLQGLQAWQPQVNLLQTIPRIDQTGAAMLLVELGAGMIAFGSAEQLASWGKYTEIAGSGQRWPACPWDGLPSSTLPPH